MATAGLPLWSPTAASNATADPAVNMAEGMAPSAVNDSVRALMASVAKWRDDLYGITTGGTSTAYTAATGSTFATAAAMSGVIFTIIPHTTSGAAPTLAVDGLTARAINGSTGVALATGALIPGTPYLVKYVHASTEFILIGRTSVLSTLDVAGAASVAGVLSLTSTERLAAPNGTTAQRPGSPAAGDWRYNSTLAATEYYDGSNWQPNTTPILMQCRLAKSGSDLVLSQHNGRSIFIDGALLSLPSTGATLTSTGLNSSTLYYAYTNSSLTLEASTTAYATDTTYGHPVKDGDDTKTLVGMFRTSTASAFIDSATQRFTRSYYNDPGVNLLNSFTGDRTSTASSYGEISSEIRLEFINWSGEDIHFAFGGSMTSNGNLTHNTSIGIDSTSSAEDVFSATDCNAVRRPFSGTLFKSGLSEGYHYATLLGLVPSGNTGTWTGSTSAGTRTTLKATGRVTNSG